MNFDSESGSLARAPGRFEPRRLIAEEVEAFVRDDVLDPHRPDPVIALTTLSGDREPPISAEWLANTVGPNGRVVVIPTGDPTWRLKAALPPLLDVYGGAVRIWWPGLARDSSPYEHPLLFIHFPEDVAQVAHRVVSLLGLEATEPLPAAAPRLSAETIETARARIDELARESRHLARHCDELEKTVERQKEELSDARQTTQALRKKLRTTGVRDAEAQDHPLSSPVRFLAEILDAYGRLYPLADSKQFPLKLLRVGPRFVESVGKLKSIGVSRISEVCAHVASGRASSIAGLQVHWLRDGDKGAAPQRVRARDGAQAWRCALKNGAPAAGRLHWWVLPGIDGGAIEFANVVSHDDMDIPD